MEHSNSYSLDFLQGEDFVQYLKETFDFWGVEPEWLGFGSLDSQEFSMNSVIDQCDIAGFSFDQLVELGFDDNDAFMISLNQAGIHHALDNMPEFSEWSDSQKGYTENFMAGVSAAVHDIDLGQLESSIDAVHTDELRAIHAGEEFAQDYIDRYGSVPTLAECKKHIESVQSEGVSHLEPQGKQPTFEGKNDSAKEWKEWHTKKADENFADEEWHIKKAQEASARGDDNLAKDHIARAKTCHNIGKDHMTRSTVYKP